MTKLKTAAAILTVLLVSACGMDSSTAPGVSEQPSFSMGVAGERRDSLSGFSLTQFMPAGWSEITNGGRTHYASDVTLFTFASLDPSKPTVNLGLLGKPRAGTYQVRVEGTSLDNPQFYGSYTARSADGSSVTYTATSGRVTIESVANGVVRGTFSFHSSRATPWPANYVQGTPITAVTANLDASGTFVARAP